ncbi:MAG: phosphate ABC transporter, permease protein PstA, partial [Halobacteriales archaeon]|nr:phosphate ABC transporter, permease protein PstA [Halobacteriales archaeon]
MAVDIERSYAAEGFGQVSRRVGTVFRYLLLAATLVGIVALALLLALVSYDAIKPQTASTGWYATLVAIFVIPSLLVGGFIQRRTPNGLTVGAIGLGIPVLGLLFGSGASMLFIDIVTPVTWLAYVVALLLPFGVVVGIERAPQVPWTARLLLVLGTFTGSLMVVPGAVIGLPVLPADWLILTLSLGVPAALLVRWYVNRRWPNGRDGRYATVAVILGSGTAAFVGPMVGLTPIPAIILTISTIVPTALYGIVVYREDPRNRVGLLLPVVIVAGLVTGLLATDILGYAGPQSWV